MVAIKLFLSVRTYFETLEFYANCKFNRKNVCNSVIVTAMFIPVSGFMLFKATSTYEFSISFYMSMISIAMAVYCAVLISKKHWSSWLRDLKSTLKIVRQFDGFEHSLDLISIEMFCFFQIGIKCTPTSVTKYAELNERIELMSKWSYIIFRLPFNWQAPFGYLISIVAEGGCLYTILSYCAPLVSFFFGSAWLIICGLDDLSHDLVGLNGNETPNQSHTKAKEHLCRIIRFYQDIKQLSVGWKTPL